MMELLPIEWRSVDLDIIRLNILEEMAVIFVSFLICSSPCLGTMDDSLLIMGLHYLIDFGIFFGLDGLQNL